MDLKKVLESNDYTVIDVRTPGEFTMGNINNSINIPLQEIDMHLDKIKNIKGNIVLCCASGMRSENALHFLKSNGIQNAVNAGSWMNLL